MQIKKSFRFWTAVAVLCLSSDFTHASWGTSTLADETYAGQYTSIAIDADNNSHIAFVGSEATNAVRYIKWNGSEWSAITDVNLAADAGYISIAVDAQGLPHIAYFDNSEHSLNYIRKKIGAGWEDPVTLDSGGATGKGKYCSIAIDGRGYPCIAYYDEDNASLKYAKWTGISWSTETVPAGEGYNVNGYISLALDGAGNPHISYQREEAASAKHLYYISWTPETGWAAPAMVDNTNDSGKFSSIALDGSGKVHISYHLFGGSNEIKYAYSTEAGWNNESVESNPDGLTSIALDGDGIPHIIYHEPSTWFRLTYSSYPNWVADVVDGDLTQSRDLGISNSLAFDSNGRACIAYSSYNVLADRYDLRFATSSFTFAAPMGGNSRGKVQAPTGFSGSLVSETQIDWSWSINSSNAFGYRVYCSSAGGNFYLAADTGTLSGNGQTGWSQTGLSPNTSYQCYAAAVNAGGVVTSSSSLVWTPANPPTGSEIVSVSSYSITLNWSDNGNPSYTRWGILRSTDNFVTSTTTLKDFSGDFTAYVFADVNLTNDVTYWYKVRAYNEGELPTDFDVPVSTFLADIIAPADVTVFAASPMVNDGEINLTWTAPGDDGTTGSINDGSLAVQHSTDSTAAWSYESAQIVISTSMAAGSSRSLCVTGLLYGSTYYFRLWTADEHLNWSEISSEASACTAGTYDTTPPAAITTLNAEVGANNGEIKLSWLASGDDEMTGGPAASYEVRYILNDTWETWVPAFSEGTLAPDPPAPSSPGSLETMIVDGLTEYTTYCFAVKIYDEMGQAQEPVVYSAVMPKSDISVPGIPQNLSGAAQDINTIRWIWDSVAGVSYKLFNGSGTQIGDTLASDEVPYDEVSLSPNTAYSRYVVAYNSGGASTASATVSCYTLAGSPSNLTALSVTDHTLNISWTAPGGGAAAYKISRTEAGESAMTVIDWSNFLSATSYADDSLASYTEYDYVVQSYNGDGVINSDTVSVIVTTQQDVTVPQTPVINPPASSVAPGGIIDISGYATDSSTENFSKVIVTIYDQDNRSLATISSDVPSSSPYFINGLFISTSGVIGGTVSVASNFSEYFPAATSIKIGIELEDDGTNRSDLTITPEITVSAAAGAAKTKIYNNIIKTPSASNPAVIRYEMPSPGQVSVKLYDLQGRLVKTIFEGQDSTNVKYWYGKNSGGNTVASGVYLLHVKAGGVEEVHKIVVVK